MELIDGDDASDDGEEKRPEDLGDAEVDRLYDRRRPPGASSAGLSDRETVYVESVSVMLLTKRLRRLYASLARGIPAAARTRPAVS